MRVIVANSLIRSFVRKAKEIYPNEYIEMLYGREVKDGFEITATVAPEQVSTADSVVWTEDADATTFDDTPSSPILLGTLHSHPREAEATPSEFDWKRQAQDGSRLSGICAIWKHGDAALRSKVRFYLSHALLDVERR